jgi:hypothetical protein
MDALLALSIVTFFETFFFRKILPPGNKKSHATHTKDFCQKKKTPKSLDFMENIFEMVKVAKIYSDSKPFYFPL